jgi:hypothetical protein
MPTGVLDYFVAYYQQSASNLETASSIDAARRVTEAVLQISSEYRFLWLRKIESKGSYAPTPGS